MVFFLFEVFFSLHLHPMQYFLAGGALSTFYLLLLALSEHVSFGWAYGIAALAVVILMSSYCTAILRERKRGILLGIFSAILYGFLYVLVQSEQHSLLLGAIGLFAALSLIMFLTRHIDWYAMSASVLAEKS